MFQKLLLLITSATLFATQQAPMQNQELTPEQLRGQNKEIAKLAASEMGKSTPQQVDKFTTLTSVSSKDATIIYNYELNIADKSDSDIIKNDSIRMKNSIIKGSCLNAKRFLEADISLKYIYSSTKSKKELFVILVDKASCKN